MAKRKVTQVEKYAIIGERMAIEGPRRPDHRVIVSVEDESDDQGNPIVIVMRMRVHPKEKRKEPAKRPK